MLALEARVQIPAHFLLQVTAEQGLQFLVLGGIRRPAFVYLFIWWGEELHIGITFSRYIDTVHQTLCNF